MEVNVIKSNRKTVGIQVNSDLSVTLRVPMYLTQRDIQKILNEKERWILKQLEKMEQRRKVFEASAPNRLSSDDLNKLADAALEYIPKRVEYFANQMGVNYGRITIRNQKTRWGSCSGKGNLNFNCFLMFAPPEVIDYVVVHELCHLKEMNHSKAFWNEVEKVLPDYRTQEKWLKKEGSFVMSLNR